MRNTILIAAIFVLTSACCSQVKEEDTPEAVLAQMRADTNWINELDSMAQIAIGEGAKCIDPVRHTFSYDGRTWFFNQDWGGVLEIPSEFIPEDDLWQAELSFHGTRAWSPDSLILISFYAGFQALTDEEAQEAELSGLMDYGFAVQSMEEKEDTLIVHARNADGINYYGRHIFANADGVEYSVSIQYPDEKIHAITPILDMINRYPAGPGNNVFKDEAL